jgi:tyrosinase
VVAKFTAEPPAAATLVGASAEPLTITDAPASAVVQLVDPAIAPAGEPQQQRIFLSLENVRGTAPSAVLNVRLSAPAAGGAVPAAAEAPVIKSVALFGLAKASQPDQPHGGQGTTVTIDITDVARKLAQAAGVPLEELQVALEQPGGPGTKVTVDKISIYQQPIE